MYNTHDSHCSSHPVQFKICGVKNVSKFYLQISDFFESGLLKHLLDDGRLISILEDIVALRKLLLILDAKIIKAIIKMLR